MIINSEDLAKLMAFCYKKGWENASETLHELVKTADVDEDTFLKEIQEAFKGKISW